MQSCQLVIVNFFVCQIQQLFFLLLSEGSAAEEVLFFQPGLAVISSCRLLTFGWHASVLFVTSVGGSCLLLSVGCGLLSADY